MDTLATAVELLQEGGIKVPQEFHDRLLAFTALVRAANAACSLVSARDEALLETVHLPDALSLGPWVQQFADASGRMVDIGSGGGFPAIPLVILFPERPVLLVERSEKKAEFLANALQLLGLRTAEVLTADFPRQVRLEGCKVVTARAVERAARVQRAVLKQLPQGGVFLSQSGQVAPGVEALFHVEQVRDGWSERGLRRGTLHVIRHR